MTSPSTPIVQVRGLTKRFRRSWMRPATMAIEDVTFDVEPGEIFGFLGPNGAGKTTTLKVLMDLIHATSGTATLFGRPLGDMAAKQKVGYLPESPYFYDHLTARESLDLIARLFGVARAERRRRIEDCLDRVGLVHGRERALRGYSKGMLQRVGLAQALVGDPALVVLDEPMSGLDPIGRKQVRDLMIELRSEGRTVFFCTHILADAELICDRVAIIVKGKLREIGPLGRLLSPEVDRVDVLWSIDAPVQAATTGEADASADEIRAWCERTDGMRCEQTSEGVLAHCERRALADALIERIVAARGRILAVTPQRQTLEEIFVRDARAADQEDRR